MATKYGNNPRLLDRAKRLSQPVSQIGKAARPGSGTQPSGVQDSHLWVDAQQVARMASQVDPLTGRPQQTGPTHLRARLAERPPLSERTGGEPHATSQ